MRKLKEIYPLFILMIIVSMLLAITSVGIIYKLVYKEKRNLLHELCVNQKEIIQSIYKETNDVNAVLNVLLKQRDITDGLGTTGEFTLGYLKDDSIVFTIRSRQKIKTKYLPVSLSSNLAAPLKYALSKNTGFIEGLDYKGTKVLSYCSYIPELKWGIVAKMDIGEVRLSFYKASIFTIISSLTLIFIAILLFRKALLPITKKIDESEEKYHRLFESAKDGILILDAATGMIVDVNPFLIERLGYTYEEFLSKTIWDIGFFKDKTANRDNFLKLQQNDYIRYENLPLETIDGRVVNVEIVSNVYLVNNKKVIQCNVRDITERRVFETRLEEKNTKLAEVNASKDKFYKIIAHDMKNPFISLIGTSELLYENAHKYDLNKIVKLAKILNDSAKNGFDMLLNLLEWSRSQTGSMLFQPVRFNLKELMDRNSSTLFEFACSKKINLHFDIGSDLQVFADKDMLNTILRNLINNALKFTAQGGEVSVSTKKENGFVIIFVKDTGVGIEKNDFDKLFRTDIKFSQPGTEREGGTGLGLLLCKEFIEKHGGEIWVESEIKKGSTFYFSLIDK